MTDTSTLCVEEYHYIFNKMRLRPIEEISASESVKASYKIIRNILQTEKVPLFFMYLGNFPKYLDHIELQQVLRYIVSALKLFEYQLMIPH